ncbi:MAG: hypothetical protein K8F36_03335 [Melioribacteraceae bacterium]|nr:hypothetical protein [Melioribacteraceae bacterium]MCO6474784.1 hypothetical protein [Melioribacteraceae bacterium]MDD3559437.1 hypothetical protein [Melioribacteraceae bacterium]
MIRKVLISLILSLLLFQSTLIYASICFGDNTATGQTEFIINEDFSQFLIANSSINRNYDTKIHTKLKPSLDQKFVDEERLTFQLYNKIIPKKLTLEIIHRTFFSLRFSTDI